jgi:hypothetical protein
MDLRKVSWARDVIKRPYRIDEVIKHQYPTQQISTERQWYITLKAIIRNTLNGGYFND